MKQTAWTDVITFVLIELFFLFGAFFGTVFGESEPVGKVILWLPALLGIVMIVAIVVKKRKAKWNFIIDGMKVWTNDIPGLDSIVVSRALDHFVEVISKEIGLSQKAVRDSFENTGLEFSPKPVSWLGIGWKLENKAGLYKNGFAKVHWKGNVRDSALFHEWGHHLRQTFYNKNPDYAHEDSAWWDKVKKVRTEWVTRG